MVVVLTDVQVRHAAVHVTLHATDLPRHRGAQAAHQAVQVDVPGPVVVGVPGLAVRVAQVAVLDLVEVDVQVVVQVLAVADVLALAVVDVLEDAPAPAAAAVLPIVPVVAKIAVVAAVETALETVRQHVLDAQDRVEVLAERDVIQVASPHVKDIVLAVVNSIVLFLTSKH